MLQRKQVINLQICQFLDGILLVLGLWLAHAFRYYGTVYLDFGARIMPFHDFMWMILVLVPFGPLILEFQGFYKMEIKKSLWRSLSEIISAWAYLLLLFGACVIFFRLEILSRSVVLLAAVFGGGLVLLRSRVMLFFQQRRARKEGVREQVVMVGSLESIQELKRSLPASILSEIEVAREFDLEQNSVSDLVQILHELSIGRVIFTGTSGHLDLIEEAIGVCELEGVEAWLVADFIRTSIAKPEFSSLGKRPMLVFRSTPEISWELLTKFVMDRVGAALGLVLCLPLFLIVAILIKMGSPGPVFFRQLRGGKHGKPFKMWKFRTMYIDAEQRRMELEELNQMSGPVFKIENDPRITKAGRWLRMTSIDEIPQLINVLFGEMSLVGPRPLPVYEVEKIEHGSQRRRLSVKPGLTCLWQISGRNEVKSFDEWVELDLKYIDNWSIWLDLRILIKTIPVVLRGTGAK